MQIHVSFMMPTSWQRYLKIKAKGVGRFSINQIDIVEDGELAFLYASGHLELMSISCEYFIFTCFQNLGECPL